MSSKEDATDWLGWAGLERAKKRVETREAVGRGFPLMRPWSVVPEQQQWLRGSKGRRGLIPGGWAREGREGKFMSCVVTTEGGEETRKRRMVSERLFANRASVEVEA